MRISDWSSDVCSSDLDTLPARPSLNYAHIIVPEEVGGLMRAIDAFSGTFTVACALKLAPLWFVRPGELRAAEWKEFDLEGLHPTWRSEERRVGKEGVGTVRSRWSPEQ